jgi:hypothetical protein
MDSKTAHHLKGGPVMTTLFPFALKNRLPWAKWGVALSALVYLGCCMEDLVRPAWSASILTAPKLTATPFTIRVNSTGDDTTADSFITLREAILIANGGTGGDGARTGLGRALNPGEAALITGGIIGATGVAASIIFSDLPGGSVIPLANGTFVPSVPPADPNLPNNESLPPILTSGVVVDGTSAVGTPITIDGSGVTVFDQLGTTRIPTDIFYLGNGIQVSDVVLRSLMVSGAQRYGIHLNQAQTSWVDQCTVTQSVSAGIIIDGSALSSDNNWINNCTVSGNIGRGIVLSGPNAFENTITNNRVGTNPAGMAVNPNGQDGVVVLTGAYNNYIVNNTISGNTVSGILFDGPGANVNGYINGNTVWGNRIGVAADGTSPLPNLQGIVLQGGATNNVIGGNYTVTGNEPNTIAYNTGSGVVVKQDTSVPTVGNKITLNYIYQNGVLGIDLLGDSLPTVGISGGIPDPLVPTLGQPGPNRLSLRPTLSFVAAFGQYGFFEGIASPLSSIALYEADQNPNPLLSNFGSGKAYCATTSTNAGGFFRYSGPIVCNPGKFFTATSTLSDAHPNAGAGSTSEFSANIANTPSILYFPLIFN